MIKTDLKSAMLTDFKNSIEEAPIDRSKITVPAPISASHAVARVAELMLSTYVGLGAPYGIDKNQGPTPARL